MLPCGLIKHLNFELEETGLNYSKVIEILTEVDCDFFDLAGGPCLEREAGLKDDKADIMVSTLAGAVGGRAVTRGCSSFCSSSDQRCNTLYVQNITIIVILN